MAETVIALLLFIGQPLELKEFRLQKSFSDCLAKKRIAMRSSSATYQCVKVKAIVEDGKIVSLINGNL
tara:strand:+ start:284 stop:487 length:204 start_codon:yes stop_codon:yes gene_type:complete